VDTDPSAKQLPWEGPELDPSSFFWPARFEAVSFADRQFAAEGAAPIDANEWRIGPGDLPWPPQIGVHMHV
jgi:hypothetical protein